MIVRLLGTATGPGFPRENCNCRCCRTAREDPSRVLPRMPLCAALSADGRHWFLLHAPSTIREQMATFTPLIPKEGASGEAPIQAVLATSSDPDPVLGFPYLNGTQPVVLYGPPDALAGGARGIPVEFRDLPSRPAPLPLRDQRSSGLLFWAFKVPARPLGIRGAIKPLTAFGYGFQDTKTGGRLVFMPVLSEPDETVRDQMEGCQALLMDGTYWDEKESVGTMVQPLPYSASHWAVGGPEGSLGLVRDLPCRYKIYVPINHTNPILIEDSVENREVRNAGAEVGRDGMEFMV